MLKKIKTNLRYNSGIIILRLFKEILLEYSTIIKHLGEVSKKKKKRKMGGRYTYKVSCYRERVVIKKSKNRFW